MKNNLPFFSHDSDAHRHRKMRALRAKYGWEGYGRFWALNEIIASADGCRLNLRKPLVRSDVACDLDLQLNDFDSFIAFLADPENCGLVRLEDGILTTGQTQDDLIRVDAKRQRDRYYRDRIVDDKGKNVSEPLAKAENANESLAKTEKTSVRAEQIRETKIRAEQTSEETPAACPLFSVQEIKNRLAFSPALDITLDDSAEEQLASALQAAGCEDLDYLDWALDRVAVRAKGKPIDNPAGYLLSVVGLSEWLSDWRRERIVRQEVKRPAGPAPPGEFAAPLGPMLSEYVKSGGPGRGARRSDE